MSHLAPSSVPLSVCSMTTIKPDTHQMCHSKRRQSTKSLKTAFSSIAFRLSRWKLAFPVILDQSGFLPGVAGKSPCPSGQKEPTVSSSLMFKYPCPLADQAPRYLAVSRRSCLRGTPEDAPRILVPSHAFCWLTKSSAAPWTLLNLSACSLRQCPILLPAQSATCLDTPAQKVADAELPELPVHQL